jgi:hypothetical protein
MCPRQIDLSALGAAALAATLWLSSPDSAVGDSAAATQSLRVSVTAQLGWKHRAHCATPGKAWRPCVQANNRWRVDATEPYRLTLYGF